MNPPTLTQMWILLAFHLLFLLYICNFYWAKLTEGNVRFNYSISDIWAAIMALAPTLLVACNLIRNDSSGSAPFLLVTLFATSQLAGIFIGRVDYLYDCRLTNLPDDRWSSAWCILIGGVLCGFLIMSAFAIAMLLLPLTLCCILAFGIPGMTRRRITKE
jgi:hypothetical protein